MITLVFYELRVYYLDIKILEDRMDLNTKLMVAHTRLAHTFMITLGKNLEELGLSVSHYSILDHLDHVGMAKTQALCRVALLTSGSVTHAVNQLVEKGYVHKVPCVEDKRVTWVELTQAGKAALCALRCHRHCAACRVSACSHQHWRRRRCDVD